MPRPLEAEDGFAVLHPGGADAARTEDAALAIEIDVGVRGIDLPRGPLIRLGRCDHAEAVAQSLQFAIAARDAVRTRMIALDKQHLDECAPIGGEERCVILDHHAMSGRGHAGGAVAAVDLAGADPAGPGGFEIRMVAEPRI